MQKVLLTISLISLVLLSFQGIKLSKGAKKKMDKAIIGAWQTEFALKELSINGGISKELNLTGDEVLYAVREMDNSLLGYAVLTHAKGRYDLFDLLIVYNPELDIQKTQVLVYREDWGGEIASARWLKQFVGMDASSKIQLSHDVQGISGATISCQSATQEIKRVTVLVNRLKEKGALSI